MVCRAHWVLLGIKPHQQLIYYMDPIGGNIEQRPDVKSAMQTYVFNFITEMCVNIFIDIDMCFLHIISPVLCKLQH